MALGAQSDEKALRETDERGFDARIVRSSLDFLSRFYAPVVEADVANSAAPFAWVPAAVCSRARGVGKTCNQYKLETPRTADECNTLATQLRIAIGDLQARKSMDQETRHAKDEWLAKQLSVLEISQHPVYREGKWQRVMIPVLRRATQCVAYAIFVIHEDRWGFRERIGVCPYRARPDSPDHFEPDHWFLDVDATGGCPSGPPKRFCSPEHANAFRQREWRRRQASAKHK